MVQEAVTIAQQPLMGNGCRLLRDPRKGPGEGEHCYLFCLHSYYNFLSLLPRKPNHPTFSVAVSNISCCYPELQSQLNSHFVKLISQQWVWDFQKKRHL